jgi:hypothetical protein
MADRQHEAGRSPHAPTAVGQSCCRKAHRSPDPLKSGRVRFWDPSHPGGQADLDELLNVERFTDRDLAARTVATAMVADSRLGQAI